MFSITCREPYVIAAMVTIAKAIMKTAAMSSTIALTIAAMFHRYLDLIQSSLSVLFNFHYSGKVKVIVLFFELYFPIICPLLCLVSVLSTILGYVWVFGLCILVFLFILNN